MSLRSDIREVKGGNHGSVVGDPVARIVAGFEYVGSRVSNPVVRVFEENVVYSSRYLIVLSRKAVERGSSLA
jgi:hypothetical protein